MHGADFQHQDDRAEHAGIGTAQPDYGDADGQLRADGRIFGNNHGADGVGDRNYDRTSGDYVQCWSGDDT